MRTRNYCQKYINGNTLLVQIKGTLTETIVLTRYNNNNTTSVVSVTNTYSYTGFKIYNYEITLSTGDHFYLAATSDEEDSWTSEPVIVVDREKLLKIQWYSNDPGLVFEFDYTNDEVNLMYIEANLVAIGHGGESTVYDNQNEKTKIKESIFRNFELQTDEIPRYLAEKLIVAMSSDVFVINDVQYTAEEKGESEPFGNANVVTFKANVTESPVLGLDTDDLGFDCDSGTTNDMIDNLVELLATGQFTLTLKAGYFINFVKLVYQDGTSVLFKAGWTVGNEEIIRSIGVTDTNDININDSGHVATDRTIYCEVSGSNQIIDVYFNTIKHTQ